MTRTLQIPFFIMIGLPSLFFHLLPSRLQIVCAGVVQHVATWVGETAQNYNNECRESEGWGRRESRSEMNERERNTERELRNMAVGRITRRGRISRT
jgi:hypothetical protein